MSVPKEEISSYDDTAEKAGLMIGISETLYLWTVSPRSIAYLECINGKWEAWRETYQNGRRKAVSVKNIASGNTLSFTLNQLKKYMDFIESKRW